MHREKELVDLIRESDVEHIDVQLQNFPAMVDARDKMGLVPLHHCVMTGHNEIAELFISKGAKPDIFSASGLGLVDQVEVMLKQRPLLYTDRDNLGLTPLHWAALGGQLPVTELLLGYGADINAKDTNGSTPLHCAAVNGHRTVAELLLYHGADPTIKDVSGIWPALKAVKEGHSDLAELLKCRCDEAMSARFCIVLSDVICAIEVLLGSYFLWRVYPNTAISRSPYMFVVALTLFAVAWIGFSVGLYARLSGEQEFGKTGSAPGRPAFKVLAGAVVGFLAAAAGFVSLVLTIANLLR
jgi:hypothetical protein